MPDNHYHQKKGFTPTPVLASLRFARSLFLFSKLHKMLAAVAPSTLVSAKLRQNRCRGFTVLIAIVIASIVIAIALSIMGITLKQLTLAGIARESEIAFQAANAGVECIRYYDISGADGDSFDVPGNGSAQGSAAAITCLTGVAVANSNGRASSGDEQLFTWTWDSSQVCTEVSVYKFYSSSGVEDMNPLITSRDCPEDVECTIIKARGYNAPCSAISSSNVVERELTVIY